MVGLLGICISVGGCTYSPGPWSGHEEQIRDYKAAPAQSTPVATKPVIEPMVLDNVMENVAAVEPEDAMALETEPSQASDAESDTTSNASTSESIVQAIATISRLDSNSTKRRYYLAIAKRSDLDEKGQVCLVNAVFDNLFSDSAMEEVLITLIQNPQFSDAGRNAITSHSDGFFSDSSKKRILAALGSG
jgi:hypothetical protein